MTTERVERSGRSPVSPDGGDGAPAFIYSGGWDQGVRKGMGVTSFGNGDEFRGRYQVGSLSQSHEIQNADHFSRFLTENEQIHETIPQQNLNNFYLCKS